MSNDNSTKQYLLSLSGGGFRGFFQASVLSFLEKELGCPLANNFSLIAGTSIGGINALALAAEIPTKDMVEFYIKWGPKIFPRFSVNPLRWAGLIQNKFGDKCLRKALTELFGDRKIADLRHNVLIPSVNYSTGKPQVFKTSHNKNLVMDGKYKLVDVALATSAAPTYFPIHKMDGLSGCYMVDGGLVANHPGYYACIEAEKYLGVSKDSYCLLHIGTMSSGVTDACRWKNSGFLPKWRSKLFDLAISAQEAATENVIKFQLGNDRYFKIDVEPPKEQIKYIALDKASKKTQEILAQQAQSAFQKERTNLLKFMGKGDGK